LFDKLSSTREYFPIMIETAVAFWGDAKNKYLKQHDLYSCARIGYALKKKNKNDPGVSHQTPTSNVISNVKIIAERRTLGRGWVQSTPVTRSFERETIGQKVNATIKESTRFLPLQGVIDGYNRSLCFKRDFKPGGKLINTYWGNYDTHKIITS